MHVKKIVVCLLRMKECKICLIALFDNILLSPGNFCHAQNCSVRSYKPNNPLFVKSHIYRTTLCPMLFLWEDLSRNNPKGCSLEKMGCSVYMTLRILLQ